jgi:hypothetical protein
MLETMAVWQTLNIVPARMPAMLVPIMMGGGKPVLALTDA